MSISFNTFVPIRWLLLLFIGGVSLLSEGRAVTPIPLFQCNDTTLTSCSGTLGDSTYANSVQPVQCSWHIQPANAQMVLFKFTEVHMSYGSNLKFYSTANQVSPLATITDDGIYSNVISSTGEMHLRMNSAGLRWKGEWRCISTTQPIVNLNVTMSLSEWRQRQGFVYGGGAYLVGDTVRMKAVPRSGHRFLHWKDDLGNILDTSVQLSFVAIQNRSIQAVFEPFCYPRRVFQGASGAISDGSGNLPYALNELTSCQWVIEPNLNTEWEFLELNFSEFAVRPEDALEITEFNASGSSFATHRLTGSNLPPSIRSRADHIQVKFLVLSQNTTHSGWTLNWQTIRGIPLNVHVKKNPDNFQSTITPYLWGDTASLRASNQTFQYWVDEETQ